MRGRLRQQWAKLFATSDTPDAIALGAAVGVSLGFTPLFGLKTLLALGLAWAFRASKITAAVGVSLGDLTLPLWPALFLLEFDLGYWLVHWQQPGFLFPRPERFDLHPGLNWTTLTAIGGPMLLGAVLLGTPASWLAFLLTRRLVGARQKAKPKERDSNQ